MADLEIRMIEASRVQDVRDMVAVLLAKGCAHKSLSNPAQASR